MSNLHYIDLGLPSGTLWANENTIVDGKEHFTFRESENPTIIESAGKTGTTIPQKTDWDELRRWCPCVWDQKRQGVVFTGPNGNSIFLPARGIIRLSFGNKIIHNIIGFYLVKNRPSREENKVLCFTANTTREYTYYEPDTEAFSVRLIKKTK